MFSAFYAFHLILSPRYFLIYQLNFNISFTHIYLHFISLNSLILLQNSFLSTRCELLYILVHIPQCSRFNSYFPDFITPPISLFSRPQSSRPNIGVWMLFPTNNFIVWRYSFILCFVLSASYCDIFRFGCSLQFLFTDIISYFSHLSLVFKNANYLIFLALY